MSCFAWPSCPRRYISFSLVGHIDAPPRGASTVMGICRAARRLIAAVRRTVDVAILDDAPYWFTHYDLEKEGLIVKSIVPSEK